MPRIHVVTPYLFRTLMLASLGLSILAFVVDSTIPALVPEPLRLAEAVYWNEMATGSFTFRMSLLIAYVIVSLVALVGLYFFKPWARTATLVLSGLLLLIAPALGHVVLSGLAQGLAEIALMLWGAVLALAYFSPISERFAATSTYPRDSGRS